MKIDGNFEVLPIAEAAGLLLDLNRRVQSFADRVGDPVLKKGHDVFRILGEHPCHRRDGLQAGADGPSMPALEVFLSPSRRLASPKISQAFFNRPGPPCPQSLLPQQRQLLSSALRQVFRNRSNAQLFMTQRINMLYPLRMEENHFIFFGGDRV
jgi:hypothetical protein